MRVTSGLRKTARLQCYLHSSPSSPTWGRGEKGETSKERTFAKKFLIIPARRPKPGHQDIPHARPRHRGNAILRQAARIGPLQIILEKAL